MSSTGYIVVSEESYGGDRIRMFTTADAEKDAQEYAEEWISDTGGNVDVIVKKINICQM